MKTIKERAKRYENTEHHLRNYSKGMLYSCYKGYVEGATDQRKIDIDNACKAFCNICHATHRDYFNCGDECYELKCFRKSMEGEE